MRKAAGHNCHDLAGAPPRVWESNESRPRSGGRWEVELMADCVLQPLARGQDTHGALRLSLAARHSQPGCRWQYCDSWHSFDASAIISVAARNQLNVTAQLPGSSDACRGFRGSLSFISCVGKKSLVPDWVPLDSNSCGL